MAYNVFRVPNGILATPTGVGQVVSTIQGYSGQTADLQQWLNSAGTILARVDSAGSISGVGATLSGDIAVNGGDVTTTAATATLFNSTATTVNIGGAATTTAIGAANGFITLGGTTTGNVITATGTINANGGTIATSQTTANLLNTTATTVNAFGASTQTNIGNGAGFIILQGTTTGNVITATGTINANGGTIATNQTTANLLNTTATTVNAFGAATQTNIGNGAGFIVLQGTTTGNVITATGTINANGGTIATSQATASLFNATATSVSAFGAATTLNIATGTMTSGVVNIATNNTSGTITLGTSSTNTIIQGNLTVNGTTTTVNSTTVATTDLNFNLGSNVAGASGSLLDGGGITLGSGASVKTLNYVNSNTAWTSSENFDIASTKTYKIAGTDVLSSTTLGNNVVLSSLQKVGTIATGVWNGTVIGTGYTTAQVTSVTAGATNTISVTGTVQAPFINLATVAQSTGSGFVKITVDAYGRVTGNTTVASGDIPNLSAAQITAGTLAVAQGGTNLSSYTTGDLLYASAATTISKLAAVASGAFLVSNGVSTSPFYRTLVTADITGALGYTPASAASGIAGTGTANKIAYWTSSSGIAADADLSYDATNNILSLGTANINTPTSDITVSQSLVNLDAFLTSSYRSAKYLVQTKSAYSAGYQVSEALLIHDGTTAYVTEYGQIYTSGSSPLITLSATVTAGSAVLQAISSSTGNLVRFYRTALNV